MGQGVSRVVVWSSVCVYRGVGMLVGFCWADTVSWLHSPLGHHQRSKPFLDA